VHHTDLQTLPFDLGDRHRPSHKIKEDMKFQIGPSFKQILEICEKLITFSYVSTFETISS
jgi:hypothetical protein